MFRLGLDKTIGIYVVPMLGRGRRSKINKNPRLTMLMNTSGWEKIK